MIVAVVPLKFLERVAPSVDYKGYERAGLASDRDARLNYGNPNRASL